MAAANLCGADTWTGAWWGDASQSPSPTELPAERRLRTLRVAAGWGWAGAGGRWRGPTQARAQVPSALFFGQKLLAGRP